VRRCLQSIAKYINDFWDPTSKTPEYPTILKNDNFEDVINVGHFALDALESDDRVLSISLSGLLRVVMTSLFIVKVMILIHSFKIAAEECILNIIKDLSIKALENVIAETTDYISRVDSTSLLRKYFPSFGVVCEHFLVHLNPSLPRLPPVISILANFLIHRHQMVWMKLKQRKPVQHLDVLVDDSRWQRVSTIYQCIACNLFDSDTCFSQGRFMFFQNFENGHTT
jgi:hypothetical protein